MDRDFSVFPKDDNGEVLWVARQRGLQIGDEHKVRFALIFPEANDALKFGVFLLRQGYWVQVNELDDKPGYAAEALVVMVLDVTHEEITGAESWLADNSASLGGKNDGWEIQGKVKAVTSVDFNELPET